MPFNLPVELEEAMFRKLRDKIEEELRRTQPRIYRARPLRAGPADRRLLSETGIAIDSSVRARNDYSATIGRSG